MKAWNAGCETCVKRKAVLRRIVEAKYLEEGLRTEQGWEDMKGENTEEEHCVERK